MHVLFIRVTQRNVIPSNCKPRWNAANERNRSRNCDLPCAHIAPIEMGFASKYLPGVASIEFSSSSACRKKGALRTPPIRSVVAAAATDIGRTEGCRAAVQWGI